MAVGSDEDDPDAGEALALAARRGCLTAAVRAAGTPWDVAPDDPDPFVRQELAETLYHVLWELVHVFFDHRGLLEGRAAATAHDAGASSFLYPFQAEGQDDLDAVLEDVRRSVLMKADEVAGLREATLGENAAELEAAAAELRRRLDARRRAARARQRRLGDRRAGRGGRHAPPTARPGPRARPSTWPTTRRSSPRSPTTSAWRRSSRAR